MKRILSLRLLLVLAAMLALVIGVRVVLDLRGGMPWGFVYEANSKHIILVDQAGEAAASGLQVGSTVAAIGLFPADGRSLPSGDLLPVSVRSGDQIQTHWLWRASDNPRLSLVALLASAIGFWLGGVVVIYLLIAGAIPAARRRQAWCFVLFAVAAAATLCCAADLEPARAWAAWTIGPAAFGTVMAYLWLQWSLVAEGRPASTAMAEQVLCGQAALMLGALELGPRLFGPSVGRPLALLAAADVLALVIAAHALALRSSRHQLGLRKFEPARVGLFLGTAWLPAAVLGWIPIVLGLNGIGLNWPITPQFAPLVVLPLAAFYPMVLTWGNLVRLDTVVRTLAVALITGTGLAAVAGWIMQILHAVLQLPADVDTALNIALGLTALPIFEPLRRRLQRIVEQRLGITSVDYQSRCAQLSEALWQALDTAEIAQVLAASAPALLQIGSIQAWLLGPDRTWCLFDGAQAAGRPCVPPAPLLVAEPDVALDPPIEGLPDDVMLCVPVHAGAELRGLLLLGVQQSGVPYRTAEREALGELAHAVATTLQRVDRIAARFPRPA